MDRIDLGIIYYTSNQLDRNNPCFLQNTKEQLRKAIGSYPMVAVSHSRVEKFIDGEFTNLVAGKDFGLYRPGRHHLNIYWQMLVGAKNIDTKYIALAEDDILYSKSHFYSKQIYKDLESHKNTVIYDMNKLSLFTWTEPQIFSFRTKRKVVNQLLCDRLYFIDALQERFERVEELLRQGTPEDKILKFFGDIGRYEEKLGVSPRKSFEVYCDNPSIVFSHPEAYGYLSQGTRKKHGDLRIIEVVGWGKASDVAKAWYEKTVW